MVFGKTSERKLSTTVFQVTNYLILAFDSISWHELELTLGLTEVLVPDVFVLNTFDVPVPTLDLRPWDRMDGSKLFLMGVRAVVFQSGLDIDEALVGRNLIDPGRPLVVISNPALGDCAFPRCGDETIIIHAGTVLSTLAVPVETDILPVSVGPTFRLETTGGLENLGIAAIGSENVSDSFVDTLIERVVGGVDDVFDVTLEWRKGCCVTESNKHAQKGEWVLPKHNVWVLGGSFE